MKTITSSILSALKRLKRALFFPYTGIRSILLQKMTVYYIVSFPKSGRTWLRVFLGKYFSLTRGIPVTLEFGFIQKPHGSIPRIAFTHDGYQAKDTTLIEETAKKLTGKKVILLVRDPRDTVVSYYFQLSKRMEERKEEARGLAMSAFLRHEKFGIPRIIAFANIWFQHGNIFKGFLLVRYEDLQKDPEAWFRRILAFLEEPIDEKAFNEAIRFSSFENMKEMEKKNLLGNERLQPGDPRDPESFKVRKGKIGGYKEYLLAEDVVFANERMKTLDIGLQYKI